MMASSPVAGEPGAPSRRTILWALVRTTVIGSVLLAAFYLWPLDPISTPEAVIKLLVYLVVLMAVAALALLSIMRADYPGLRALTALSAIIPLYIFLFAAGYYVLAVGQPHSFTQPIGRTDALYFTITVFSTVGFGDIAPVTQVARIVTTVQMVLNLLILGVLLNAVIGAVKHRRSTRASSMRQEEAPGGQAV
jgi:voltage-gated potassium channel